MMKFKLEGYQVGILSIIILFVALGITVLLIPNESTPPSDTTNQPTDQPIDQPTGDSNTGLDIIVMIVAALIPVFLILIIFQL